MCAYRKAAHWNFPRGQKSFTNISQGLKPVPGPHKALRKYLFKDSCHYSFASNYVLTNKNLSIFVFKMERIQGSPGCPRTDSMSPQLKGGEEQCQNTQMFIKKLYYKSLPMGSV